MSKDSILNIGFESLQLDLGTPKSFLKDGKRYVYFCDKHQYKGAIAPFSINMNLLNTDWKVFCSGCLGEFLLKNIGEMEIMEYQEDEIS